jgi:4-alpha-glucanotransferase
MKFDRLAGALLHPTSLPGKYGIGTLGKSAIEFVDFMAAAEQSLWQMFPLGPTGYGNSPYQSFSAFAGNPLLIDLDDLVERGLLSAADLAGIPELPEARVDYAAVIEYKMPLLKKAAALLAGDADMQDRLNVFTEDNSIWLNDYAFFMALKEHFGGGSWSGWELDIRRRDEAALVKYREKLATEIAEQTALQYLFFEQWFKVKNYANSKGIKIVGDIPIFVAFDSSDAWGNPELFEFDEDMMPIRVAGVPPDYFCKTGQLWGNPLYDWEYSRKTGFAWWIERVRGCLKMSDIIRIDHFRGFVSCWAVPAKDETAEHGSWEPAAGKELFEAVAEALGDLPIIAEDLGFITPEVDELRDSNGFPGMKILTFAFDSSEDSDFLPHNYTANSVVYTGTHDNDTACGWYAGAGDSDRQFALDYLDATAENFVWKLIRTAWASPSVFALAQLQDFLELGTEARMNMPGSSSGNWEWRFKKDMLTDDLAAKLKKLTEIYRRKMLKKDLNDINDEND